MLVGSRKVYVVHPVVLLQLLYNQYVHGSPKYTACSIALAVKGFTLGLHQPATGADKIN